MQVVLESIEGQYVTLIPDDLSESIVVTINQLPDQAVVGDVLRLQYRENSMISLERLNEETEKRKARIKRKREKLLKKNTDRSH